MGDFVNQRTHCLKEQDQGKTAQQSLFAALQDSAGVFAVDRQGVSPSHPRFYPLGRNRHSGIARGNRLRLGGQSGRRDCLYKVKVNPSTSYIVIPARLASTRLPRKLLLRDDG